jgi:hypothetical protein
MIRTWKGGLVVALVFVVGAAVGTMLFTSQSAQGRAADDRNSAGPHYSVVVTEAHNLLVTDNAANKLYFYTIDKDKPIGSPLKLRASIDLGKVGEEEIRITPHNLEK